MRWLGQMQRAFELMCRYALEREAFGGPLAEKQTVQNWIADSAAEIQACRLLTLDAAGKLDEGGEARVEVSLIKFYAAQILNDVIDRAIQVHGARGLTDETPLAFMAQQARAARIYDGPDEVHRMVVSRRILKEFADGASASIASARSRAWLRIRHPAARATGGVSASRASTGRLAQSMTFREGEGWLVLAKTTQRLATATRHSSRRHVHVRLPPVRQLHVPPPTARRDCGRWAVGGVVSCAPASSASGGSAVPVATHVRPLPRASAGRAPSSARRQPCSLRPPCLQRARPRWTSKAPGDGRGRTCATAPASAAAARCRTTIVVASASPRAPAIRPPAPSTSRARVPTGSSGVSSADPSPPARAPSRSRARAPRA